MTLQSVLLIGKSREKRENYITDFCHTEGIGKFDIHYFAPTDNSFGIQQVKDLQKIAYLKPSAGIQKALILEDAQTLTLDAQNALLKLLEEPPQNTFVFLSATHDTSFLPTVLSRCKKVIFTQDPLSLTAERVQELTQDLHVLAEQGSGNKLFL